jgi:hypothetical protein
LIVEEREKTKTVSLSSFQNNSELMEKSITETIMVNKGSVVNFNYTLRHTTGGFYHGSLGMVLNFAIMPSLKIIDPNNQVIYEKIETATITDSSTFTASVSGNYKIFIQYSVRGLNGPVVGMDKTSSSIILNY